MNITASDAAVVSKKKHKKRKAAKGQLKKLWRRATGPPPGITSRSDWNSLVELCGDYKVSSSRMDDSQNGNDSTQGKISGGGVATDHEAMMGPLPGPTVCLATHHPHDFGQLDNWQTTEGCDHRDLLVNFLFGRGATPNNSTMAKAQKKRKICPIATDSDEYLAAASQVNVPPLPSWSAICNQASVGGVAIIEIEIVGGDISTTCPLMPSQRITNSIAANNENVWTSLIHRRKNGDGESVRRSENQSNKVKRAIAAACRVNLFQEKCEPRCLSDVLMFLPPSPPPDQSNELKNSSVGFDIFRAMEKLLLKPKQLRSEGFPLLSYDTSTSSATVGGTLERQAAMRNVLEISKSSQLKKNRRVLESTCDAVQLVRTLSVNVGSNDVNTTSIHDEFSSLECYVRSFSHRCASNEKSGENDEDEYQRKIFALDCEMVQTSSDEPELARVSMIMFTGFDEENEKSVVVLDELVKPRRTVLDHLTREYLFVYTLIAMHVRDGTAYYVHPSIRRLLEYSGVTSVMLQSVETRIEDIQLKLLSMIDEDDIIVGHSLENDLQALRIVHGKIIDTAVLFRGRNGRKFSLKHLSNVLLQRKIQCSTLGHCSTEDAEAALTLALHRARLGDSFKLKENSSRQNIISIFQKVNFESNGHANDAEVFAERNIRSCVCIGKKIVRLFNISRGSL